jgi:dihydropyrimidine dehydrogenase (NADP+)
MRQAHAGGTARLHGKHKFNTLADFKGKSLPYFTTHFDLVQKQAQRKAAQKAAAQKKVVSADGEWSGDSFVQQSDALSLD